MQKNEFEEVGGAESGKCGCKSHFLERFGIVIEVLGWVAVDCRAWREEPSYMLSGEAHGDRHAVREPPTYLYILIPRECLTRRRCYSHLSDT